SGTGESPVLPIGGATCPCRWATCPAEPEAVSFCKPTPVCERDASFVPVGGSPTGTGESPALPIGGATWPCRWATCPAEPVAASFCKPTPVCERDSSFVPVGGSPTGTGDSPVLHIGGAPCPRPSALCPAEPAAASFCKATPVCESDAPLVPVGGSPTGTGGSPVLPIG